MRPEQKSEKSKSFFGDDEGHLHMRPWTGFILTTWETAEDTRAQKWVGIDRVTEKRRSHQRRGRTTGGWVLCYCDLTEFCWLQGKATGVGAECFNQRERHDPVWRVLSSYSWAHSNGRQRQMHTVGRAHNSLLEGGKCHAERLWENQWRQVSPGNEVPLPHRSPTSEGAFQTAVFLQLWVFCVNKGN